MMATPHTIRAIHSKERMKSEPTVLLWTVILLLATAAVYWPGLGGGFIFDDRPTIVDNARVHAEHLDGESLLSAARSFDPGGTLGARPLSMASFAANHALHGLHPRGYKLGGLLVHLLNALLVFAVVRSVLRQLAWPRAELASGAIALVWAIHPLQVSSVLYVVQRMETLSFTFILAALIYYIKGRQRQMSGRRAWPWLMACLPLTALGMTAKESAALFPAFTFMLEITVLGFSASNPTTTRNWRWLYATGIIVAIAVFTFWTVPSYWKDEIFGRNFNTYERLLTQLRILPMYLGQILLPLPSNMTFYYDNFPVSHGWLAPPATMLGGILIAALGVVAIACRRSAPLASLGLLWFFSAHALTSNVVALELVFEHRNYFALLGIILVVADLFGRLKLPEGPALKYAAVGAIILGFAGLTAIRSATWGDPFLLATDLASINPGSSRASADLAAIYLEMTDGHPNSPFNDLAIREFERGSLIPGSSIISDQGLILTAAQAGRPIEDRWWHRLNDKLRHGTLSAETTQGMFGLLGNRMKGIELDDDHLTNAFLILFDRAIFPPQSYAQFGDYVLTVAGNEALADQAFASAIEHSSRSPDYARQIINTLRRKGHHRQAEIALDKAHEMGMLDDMTIDPSPTSPSSP